MTTSAKIIADSISPDGTRLITFEVEFHRFVLAEVNTHRVFSRNYQSSRAVPVEKMLRQVENNPAMPVSWGKNQAGMQAGEELTGIQKERAEAAWREGAALAAGIASKLINQGVHKQIANRVLEPYVWTKGVITVTQEASKGYFDLRCHEMAQPEFRVLAELMSGLMDSSIPTVLDYGMWHMPYYLDGYWHSDSQSSLSDAIKIATSCIAQVSYRRLDDSLEKAHKIYDMLNLPTNGEWPENPPHFSPAEHCALCLSSEESNAMWEADMEASDIGGNFQTDSFYQYRKMLEQGVELDYIGVSST